MAVELSASEIETVRQIVGVATITYTDISNNVDALEDAQRTMLIADAARWVLLYGKHANLDGEVKLKQNDKRNEIIERVSTMLGLPFVPYERRSAGGGADSITRHNITGGCWYG